MRRLGAIFALSFVLNLAWEHAHALLYAGYQGSPITKFILWRATLADAVFITAIAAVIFSAPFLRKHEWLMVPLGLVLAVCIELWALHTGRWAYNPLMPVIPWLNIGLTPTLQLALTGYAALWLTRR